MNLTVSLSTDADGFVSQECPVCRRRFKVVFGEGSDRPIGHCSYCGHTGRDCWWTRQQAAYLRGVVGERVVDPMLDDFARSINRMNRAGSLVQMKASVKRNPRSRRPVEPSDSMAVVTFRCCGERIKHDGSTRQLYCVICGKLIDVASDDPGVRSGSVPPHRA